MLSNLTGMHALIILAIVVFLFGAAKLPALARSVGQSVRILKKEVDGTAEETTAPAATVAAAPAATVPTTTVPAGTVAAPSTADPVVTALAATPVGASATTGTAQQDQRIS